MRRALRSISLQTWILLYVGCVALGAGALFGGGLFPTEWFSAWHWWQRLLLVLLASPILVPVLVVGYALCEALLEGLFLVLTFALKEHTLPTVVAVVVLVGAVLARVGLLRG
jgi:hypothetical protein